MKDKGLHFIYPGRQIRTSPSFQISSKLTCRFMLFSGNSVMNQSLLHLFLLMMIPVLAWAQPDTLLIDQYDLEGVVISADKRENRVMEVAASATSLSGFSLENERIQTTTDLTGPVPNLYMPEYGSRLTSPIYIRGIGSRINAPSVGFYIDEVALFEKATFHFDMYDIQRIEVLRGPQGTLYGRNTIGGIVHVITREPDNQLGLKMLAEVGSYGQQQYQLKAGGPLVRDRLFAQVNGFFRGQNGFHTNEFTGNQVDHLKSGGGRIKMIYQLASKTRLIWQMYRDVSNEGGYPYAVVPEQEDDLTIGYDHESSYRRDLIGTSLRAERKGNRVALHSITAFQTFRGDQDIDQDFTPLSLLWVTQQQDQQLYTQEFRINSARPEDLFQWIAGAYGFYQLNDQRVDVTYGDDGIPAFGLPYSSYSYRKQSDMTNYGAALFGQGSLRDLLLEGMELTIGIRVDYEKDQLDFTYDRTANGNTSRADDFVSGFDYFELLPKFSLKYKWNSDQMTYLSATRGYKSGGFNTTFERNEDQSFDPEYSWNYEAGWKAALAGNRLNLGLALYYIDWQNLQVYQPIPSGRGSMLKNAASAHSQGVELEISARPLKNFRLSGSLGYADVRLDDFSPDPDETLNYKGNRVPYVPDLTGFASSSCRIPFRGALFREMAFSLNWKQTGTIYWNDANEFHQNPCGLMGASIYLGISDFDLRIWSANLLNHSYRSFQFTAIGNVYAQPGRPRTFGITLSYQL